VYNPFKEIVLFSEIAFLSRCESGSGKCKDVVIMDEGGNVLSVSTDISSFVAPRHRHRTACICKEGFAGDRCDTILVNNPRCSKGYALILF